MGRQICTYGEYKVYSAKGGYIVHNTKKPFKGGHTHVKDFGITRYLIHLSKHKIVPDHLSKYLFESLLRISNDKLYCKQLRCVLDDINIIEGGSYYEQNRTYKKRSKNNKTVSGSGKSDSK